MSTLDLIDDRAELDEEEEEESFDGDEDGDDVQPRRRQERAPVDDSSEEEDDDDDEEEIQKVCVTEPFQLPYPGEPPTDASIKSQVQEGFIDDEDEEADDSDERERRRRRKRRRAERDEEAQLDEEDLDLIGEANPEFQSREQPQVRHPHLLHANGNHHDMR